MEISDPTNGRGEASALEDDRKWFANYTGRSYRHREAMPFEFRQPFEPDGHFRIVVVRRAFTGDHVRAWIRLPKDGPIPAPNDDAALEALFNRATIYDAPRS
jgi:hypothetical protein